MLNLPKKPPNFNPEWELHQNCSFQSALLFKLTRFMMVFSCGFNIVDASCRKTFGQHLIEQAPPPPPINRLMSGH